MTWSCRAGAEPAGRAHPLIFGLGYLLFFVVFAACPSPARAQSQDTLPPALAAFAAQVQQALRNGEVAAGQPLAKPPDRLAWRGHPSDWNLAVLPVPTRAGSSFRFLGVFSRFHGVQSSGDLVFALVRTTLGWQFGPEIPETKTRGYRVRDHRLTVHFDLPRLGALFTDDVTIERVGTQADPCLLRLSCDMHVDSITGDRRPLPARQVPGLLALVPPRKRRFVVSLAYHRVSVPSGGDFIQPTEIVLLSYWYPHIARLPARDSLTVTVPRGWTAAGQGELVRRVDEAGESRFTFRNDVPTCYLSLVAGPFTTITRKVQGRKLSAYQLRPDRGRANQALDQLAQALPFFEARFGPFPYSHYELVETPGSGSALEAYSFATFSGGDFGPLVHELAHTWWGGILPNPYTTSLWSEVFAEYSGFLFARQESANRRVVSSLHPAPDYGRSYLRRFPVPIAEARDVFIPAHGAAAYGKGPEVLIMLEDWLGTKTMLRCLRRFREAHVPGEAADWPDFERAVRHVTGQDYHWYFQQWLHRPGAPTVGLTGVHQAAEGDRFVVTGSIVQEGTPYRLRLPLVLELDGGQTIRQSIEAQRALTPFRITSPAAPRSLQLDPEGTVLMAGITRPNGGDPFSERF